jgi:hypothetical protein
MDVYSRIAWRARNDRGLVEMTTSLCVCVIHLFPNAVLAELTTAPSCFLQSGLGHMSHSNNMNMNSADAFPGSHDNDKWCDED